ncbi:MAG: M81 family metallopeptidase [Chloroflexi bacterium]|nr:M81 family metallopeptidase [Chloroflexota bacterium]
MKERIFIAQFSQETGSFLPRHADLSWFTRHLLVEGEGLIEAARQRRLELAGALAACQEAAVEPVPGLAAWAMPWGVVEDKTYRMLRDRLLSGLRAAHASRALDGVLLVLHGAMQAGGEDDPEGDLLAAVRRIVGPHVPLAATLDLHANVTDRMAAMANILVAYHTVPHVDMYETGHEAMRLLIRAARGEIRPVVSMRKMPMVTPAERHDTRQPPMAPLMEHVRAATRSRRIMSASLCAVQPWLDVPELGWTSVVVTDAGEAGAHEAAQRTVDDLAAAAWDVRRAFLVRKLPVTEVVRRAVAAPAGRPVVVSDSGDNTSGGAPGDSVHLLRHLLAESEPCSALLWLADAQAVATCAASGIGTEIAIELGHKADTRFGTPLRVAVRVERSLARTGYVIQGPSWTGTPMDMGRTVVLTVLAARGSRESTDLDTRTRSAPPPVRLVVCEHPVMDIDPGLYRCVGEEPAAYQLVQVRSPAAFRATYEPLASEIVHVESPGPTTSELHTLPWRKVPRPLFPLDLDDGDDADQARASAMYM